MGTPVPAWLVDVTRQLGGPRGARLSGLGTTPGNPVVEYDTVGDGFDWSALPALARDLYIAYQQGNLQGKLLEINLERARLGQPPLNINPSVFQPGVQVGLSSDVKTLLLVLGVGAIAAVALRRRG